MPWIRLPYGASRRYCASTGSRPCAARAAAPSPPRRPSSARCAVPGSASAPPDRHGRGAGDATHALRVLPQGASDRADVDPRVSGRTAGPRSRGSRRRPGAAARPDRDASSRPHGCRCRRPRSRYRPYRSSTSRVGCRSLSTASWLARNRIAPVATPSTTAVRPTSRRARGEPRSRRPRRVHRSRIIARPRPRPRRRRRRRRASSRRPEPDCRWRWCRRRCCCR